MKRKAKMRKKGKINKTLVSSFGIILFTLIIILALHLKSPQPPKKSIHEFFSFSDGFAVVDYIDNATDSIRICQISFNITAIGGDATEVYIYPLEGAVRLEESPYFDKIVKGKTVSVGPLTYRFKVVSTKEANGYPVHFYIMCREAEGTVRVNVTRHILTIAPPIP